MVVFCYIKTIAVNEYRERGGGGEIRWVTREYM